MFCMFIKFYTVLKTLRTQIKLNNILDEAKVSISEVKNKTEEII